MSKVGKKTKEPWHTDDVVSVLGEALGFARVAVEAYKIGPIVVPDDWKPGWSDFSLGAHRRCQRSPDGRPEYPRTWIEPPEAVQLRVVDRLIAVLELTQSKPFKLAEASWYCTAPGELSEYRSADEQDAKGRSTISDKEFLEMVVGNFPSKESIFRWGPNDVESIDAFYDCMERARRAAGHARASSGPLSDDERRVLHAWRSIGKPLRYREVTALIFDGRSYSAQESRTGNFLRRFAEKTGPDNPSQAPYVLLPGAVERDLGAVPKQPVHIEETMTDAALELRIARVSDELDALRKMRDDRSRGVEPIVRKKE